MPILFSYFLLFHFRADFLYKKARPDFRFPQYSGVHVSDLRSTADVFKNALYDLRVGISVLTGTFLSEAKRIGEVVCHAFLRIYYIFCILAEDLIEILRLLRCIVNVRSVDRHKRYCRVVKEGISLFFKVSGRNKIRETVNVLAADPERRIGIMVFYIRIGNMVFRNAWRKLVIILLNREMDQLVEICPELRIASGQTMEEFMPEKSPVINDRVFLS